MLSSLGCATQTNPQDSRQHGGLSPAAPMLRCSPEKPSPTAGYNWMGLLSDQLKRVPLTPPALCVRKGLTD